MENYYNENKIKELEKLVGNTPMVKITYKFKNQTRSAYFKLEWYNYSGSIKDRVALNIYKQAYIRGALKPNQVVAETTSGNMGISFCHLGTFLGHKTTIFMPESMSDERKKLLVQMGANLVLCKTFKECFEKTKEYQKTDNAFLPSQFENDDNKMAHYIYTAPEIEKVFIPSAVLSGVGTGGTLIGVGGYFKQKYKSQVIAIEPSESLLLSLGKSQGKHQIQGLSDDVIPKIYDASIVDRVINLKSLDAIAVAQKLAKAFGLGVGISGGANFLGCALSGIDNVVSFFPDDNKKYISTALCEKIDSPLADSIELIDMQVL